MTLSAAAPMQLLLISCEVVCALENRLCLQKEQFHVPGLKCDIVLEEILDGILSKTRPDEMFCARRIFSGEDVMEFFTILEHGSLSFGGDGLAKLISIACTAVRVQLVRLGRASDMLDVLNTKMTTLVELFPNARTKEVIRRLRNASNVYYGARCEGEMNRIRTSIINSLRTINTPVEALIQAGMQSTSGRAVCTRHGPSVQRLGLCGRFVDGLDLSIESRFVVAEQKEAVQEGESLREQGNAGNL